MSQEETRSLLLSPHRSWCRTGWRRACATCSTPRPRSPAHACTVRDSRVLVDLQAHGREPVSQGRDEPFSTVGRFTAQFPLLHDAGTPAAPGEKDTATWPAALPDHVDFVERLCSPMPMGSQGAPIHGRVMLLRLKGARSLARGSIGTPLMDAGRIYS